MYQQLYNGRKMPIFIYSHSSFTSTVKKSTIPANSSSRTPRGLAINPVFTATYTRRWQALCHVP